MAHTDAEYMTAFVPSAQKGLDTQGGSIHDFCLNVKAMNWIRIWDFAYGRDGKNEEAYKQQPGDVKVYNPESLPLKDILTIEQVFDGRKIEGLAYIDITINGSWIWIPYYYVAIENMFELCPGCVREKKRLKTK